MARRCARGGSAAAARRRDGPRGGPRVGAERKVGRSLHLRVTALSLLVLASHPALYHRLDPRFFSRPKSGDVAAVLVQISAALGALLLFGSILSAVRLGLGVRAVSVGPALPV